MSMLEDTSYACLNKKLKSLVPAGILHLISFKTLNMVAIAKIPTRMLTIAITIIFEEPAKHPASASVGGCYLHLCANAVLAESLSSVLVCIEPTKLIE